MDATPASITERPARAERDGCDCPAWVIRCAHFGTTRLTLGQTFNVGHAPSCHYASVIPPGPYRLGPYSAPWMTCPDCGLVEGFNDDFITERRWLHDESDALAAFYEAEQTLLRGDADA